MVCRHSFLHTNCSRVCTKCGLEEGVLFLDTFNPCSAPLTREYNRTHRFLMKVDRLLGISAPASNDKVWRFLKQQTFHDPASLRLVLRNSKMAVKHYDSIRCFCDAFTEFRCKPYDSHATKTYLLRSFAEILARWSCVKHDNFYSYDWLLRVLLEYVDSPLVVYLKPMTAKRRQTKYKRMLSTPLLNVHRNACPQSLIRHPQSGEALIMTPLYQSHVVLGRGGSSKSADQGARCGPSEDRGTSPSCKTEKPRGEMSSLFQTFSCGHMADQVYHLFRKGSGASVGGSGRGI